VEGLLHGAGDVPVPSPHLEPIVDRQVRQYPQRRPAGIVMMPIGPADRGRESGDEGVVGVVVASVTAKIGASVDSEPSIRPVIAGWP